MNDADLPSSFLPLGLQPGDSLQLQSMADDKRRFRARLVGYVPYQSVVVTAPSPEDKVLLIREGEMFMVRGYVGDHAVAFRSRVLMTQRQPYAYMHLSYPQELEKAAMRKAPRIRVERMVNVVNDTAGGAGVVAVMRDLSATGALIESVNPLGNPGDRLVIETSFDFEGMPDQAQRLTAVIRNLRDPAGEAVGQGVEFHELTPEAALSLRAYVYERLARGQGSRG